MLSEKLKQAISMVKAGDKLAARKLLVEILDGEPTNETAWLWFTDTLNSDAEKKIALEGLLKINPASQAAKLGLQRLTPQAVVLEDDGAVEEKGLDYQPVEADPEPEREFQVESDAVESSEDPTTVQAYMNHYMPMEHDGAPAEVEGILASPADAPAPETTTIAMATPTAPATPAGTTAAPAANVGIPAASAAATSAPTATANPPRKPTIPAGLGKIVLILVAFIILGGAVYFFADMLGLFASSEGACKCPQTDAYLLRVQDRVSRWLNNQALYILAENHGDAPQNTDFAQQLYDEENKESVPVCLKNLHETLLTTFENHIKYGAALQKKDVQQIEYYRGIEGGMQDQLKTQFEGLKTTLKCVQ
jgi:hypothetical protein